MSKNKKNKIMIVFFINHIWGKNLLDVFRFMYYWGNTLLNIYAEMWEDKQIL